MLVDSHCHLNFKDFSNDLKEVIQRAKSAGIQHMLSISTRLDEGGGLCALAESDSGISCTIGVHPHEAEAHRGLEAATLIERAAHPRVAGLGETGLDFHYNHSPADVQKACFQAHIEAARETSLPLVIHSRNADAEMARILSEEAGKGGIAGVMHCFSAGPELARTALEAGFYISFSGILTFKKAGEVRAIASEIPLDRLLVETDAPYLAPEPHRGKRNEPAFVMHTAAKLAEIRGIPLEALAEATTANFHRLFGRVSAGAG